MNCLKFFFIFILFAEIPSAQSKSYTGSIIDIHSHISLLDDKITLSDRTSEPSDLKKNYEDSRYKKIGVVVIAFKWENEKDKNDSLISFCRTDNRYFPVCSVYPERREDALAELDRIHSKRVRFLKIHALAQGIDLASENVHAVIKKASGLGFVILFDGWNPKDANMLMKIVELANENPKGKFIIAHAGGANFNETILIAVFKMYEWYHNNIWVDLSGTALLYENSPYSEQLKWTLRKIGIEKVLFGSDFPVSTAEDAVKAVESYGFNNDELDAIFYSNAKKLLDSVGIE